MSSLLKERQQHRNLVKQGLSISDTRRTREDTTIKIRKTKRSTLLKKRRADAQQGVSNNLSETSNTLSETPWPEIKNQDSTQLPPWINERDSLLKVVLSSFVDGNNAQAKTSKEQEEFDLLLLQATRRIREHLSQPAEIETQAILQCNGLVEKMVEFLYEDEKPILQFEAAWVLTNIASTDHTRLVYQAGAVEPLVRCLKSCNPNTREQAVWCLGNIAGDTAEFRDTILSNPDTMINIQNNVLKPSGVTLLRNIAWTVSNFCRQTTAPLSENSVEILSQNMPLFAHLVSHGDAEVVADACWGMSYFSDGSMKRAFSVLKTGILPRLITILYKSADENWTQGQRIKCVHPALRVIGNIVTADDETTQCVVDAGAIEALSSLLQDHMQLPKNIVKEACWTISNIAAGTEDQINRIINDHDILPIVISLALKGAWEVRKEAAWVLGNIFCTGTFMQAMKAINLGAIESLCSMIDAKDTTIVMMVLESFDTILKSADNAVNNAHLDKVLTLIDEFEGIDKIEELQNHADEGIFQKAASIIETHFDGISEEANPKTNTDGTFAFGV